MKKIYGNFAELLIKNIIDYIPYSIFWKDKNSVFLGCNEAFAKTTGFKSPEEIVGKTDYDLPWTKEESDLYREDDAYVMQTKSFKINIEEPQTLSDGTEIVLLTSKVPLISQNGEVVGVVGIYTDITRQKMQEAALKRALSVKSEFIANMSHDIRTPITGILGLARSLRDHFESETNQNEAQLLIGASEQLLSLLNEIIEVVRIEEGKLTDSQKDFDLIAIVKNNIELLQPALYEKGLRLNYQIDSQVPRYLFGQRLFLDRILLNLLSNAIKFTKNGHVALIISIKKIKKTQVVIEIVIEDTGIGIPADKKEVIFEHFSRLSPSYEGRYGGYGLGLYTVKRYLEAMKGHIEVESELGKGSRFILTIPFKIGKEVSSEITRVFEQEVPSDRFSPELVKKIPGKEKEVPSKKKKILRKEKPYLEQSPETVSRILLVEDNRLAALMATRLLAERNCEIVHVQTGTDALERITRERFDLILMDLGLPDQSGMEVAQKIRARANHLNVNVPIVALTGHLSSDQRQACIAAGMQDMLVKPLTALTGQQLLMKYGSTATDSLNALKLQEPEISMKLSVIDLERGMNILGGDLAGAKEALDILAQSLPLDYQQIQTHYNAKDYEALYQIIHKLYGGLCYCGTPSLHDVTQSLKQALLDKKIKKLPLLMQYLQKEVERFQQAHQHLKQQEDF